MPADDTRRLTAALAAGDAAAVDEFHRRWFPFLLSTARRATGRDESFCLDVVQESVLRVLRAIRPADTEPQLRAWLRLVVQTTALDLLRRERRRARHESLVTPVGEPVEGNDDERLDWLRRQIAQFDPELSRIVGWRFAEGWTLRRIAERLGLSVGAVDGRLRRALADLRDRASEVFDG